MSLKIGDKAPEFSLYDADRKLRSLSEFLGKKTVLAFYPGAFTGVCAKEMCSFRDSLAALNTMNAQVIGISIDSPFANKAFADQNKLGFPLLSDLHREVSNRYAGTYAAFAGVPGYNASVRSVFVLDAAGTVRFLWATENPGTEPDYEAVRNAVASL
jgi:peroxiredoxin